MSSSTSASCHGLARQRSLERAPAGVGDSVFRERRQHCRAQGSLRGRRAASRMGCVEKMPHMSPARCVQGSRRSLRGQSALRPGNGTTTASAEAQFTPALARQRATRTQCHCARWNEGSQQVFAQLRLRCVSIARVLIAARPRPSRDRRVERGSRELRPPRTSKTEAVDHWLSRYLRSIRFPRTGTGAVSVRDRGRLWLTTRSALDHQLRP